jgi:tRNA(Ser,Leu) C12 N-acetylase TAN1
MMQEWNAVISVREHGFRQAFDVFGEFGEVKRTEFYNVLLLRGRDVTHMLETLRERANTSPGSLAFLARLIPVTRTFIFNSPEEFEDRTRSTVLNWAPQLQEKSFYVRIHRRGFRGRLSSPEEERLLAVLLLEELERSGKPGRIAFENPDAVIVIETVGHWAGLSLFTREDKERHPFIRIE